MKQSNLAAGEEREGLGRVENSYNSKVSGTCMYSHIHMDVPARVNVLLLNVGVTAVSEHWITVPSNVSDTVTVSSDVKSAKGGLGTALTITALNCPLSTMSPTLASDKKNMEPLPD